MEEKKLGLKSVISVSVGLVIATSCLVSLGQGAGTIGVTFIFAMVIACLFNMTTIASLSELNALMPNTTGGLAQYTLACLGPFPTMISMVGGYLFCNVLSSGVEASIFAYAMGEIFHLPIPNFSYTVLVTVILLIANLKGVDMFAKIQDAVAYLMVGHNARQIPDEKVGRAPGGLFRAVRFRAGKLFRSCCHQSIRQRDERADDVP